MAYIIYGCHFHPFTGDADKKIKYGQTKIMKCVCTLVPFSVIPEGKINANK